MTDSVTCRRFGPPLRRRPGLALACLALAGALLALAWWGWAEREWP